LDIVPEGGIIELAAGSYSAPPGGWTIYPGPNGGTRSFTVRAAAGAGVALTGNGASRTITEIKNCVFQNNTATGGPQHSSPSRAIHRLRRCRFEATFEYFLSFEPQPIATSGARPRLVAISC
jgi:hypothetical protein